MRDHFVLKAGGFAVLAVLAFVRLAHSADSTAFFTQASEALKQGHLDEALAAYQKAEDAAATPAGRSNAANGAGFALMKVRRFPEAIEALKRAVAANPAGKTAWANLGDSHMIMYEGGLAGRPALAEAIGAYQKVAAMDTQARAESLELAQRYEEQERAWEEAAKARGANPPGPVAASGPFSAFKAAGDAAERDGDFETAAANYRKAESVASTDKGRAVAANLLGLLALKQRKIKAAAEEFHRATRLDPANKYAWNNRGAALRRVFDATGNRIALREASESFRRVAEIDPEYNPANREWAEREMKANGIPETAAAAPVNGAAPAPVPANGATAATAR